jgi:hypothetical protein
LLVAISVAEPKSEPKGANNFGGAEAGAVTRCSSGSKLNVLHKWIINKLFPFIFVSFLIKQNSKEKVPPFLWLSLVCFQKVGWVKSRVGA